MRGTHTTYGDEDKKKARQLLTLPFREISLMTDKWLYVDPEPAYI